MKKITTAALFLMLTGTAFAQEGRVGINTTDPKTTFDVNGKIDGSGKLLTTDITGMQAPRLTRAELTAKGDVLYGADQKGALVYITDVTAGDALTQRINITAAGYYYFDGAVWQKMASASEADFTNDAWVNDAPNTMVKLGTLSDGTTARPAGREFVILDTGNVGIGTTAPNSNAILDLSATNKAILLPRLANKANISSPVNGMVIYDTGKHCYRGYANGAWVNITTCPATVTVASPTYQGTSVISTTGIGYNGENVPTASTITVQVTTDEPTAYNLSATHPGTGLVYSATGNFAAAGTYPVVLQNNGAAIPWATFGVLTMPLTGASNSINLVPRIDIKSIPASATAVVDVTYGTQKWMDRNLGARRVATAIDDVLSYGNHYQWGRPADGHEISVWDGATPTSGRGFHNATKLEDLATSVTPGHPNFILTNAKATSYDWLAKQADPDRWATANQGPCPAGYHVPTDAQWAIADAFNGGALVNGGATVGWDNNTETYNSALKLPSAGYRNRFNGLLNLQGSDGIYWSSTVSGSDARGLGFDSTAASTGNDNRAFGFTVRCLKD